MLPVVITTVSGVKGDELVITIHDGSIKKLELFF
jgi:hypothetical protein